MIGRGISQLWFKGDTIDIQLGKQTLLLKSNNKDSEEGGSRWYTESRSIRSVPLLKFVTSIENQVWSWKPHGQIRHLSRLWSEITDLHLFPLSSPPSSLSASSLPPPALLDFHIIKVKHTYFTVSHSSEARERSICNPPLPFFSPALPR